MNAGKAIQELKALEGRLGSAKLIDDSGRYPLQVAVDQLEAQEGKDASTWHYAIDRDAPLTFRITDPKSVKHRMQIDVSGRVCQLQNGIAPGEHSVVVRAWCLDKSAWFNDQLDNPDLEQEIGAHRRGRVMLRFRFEFRRDDLDEPWFHLQIGGQQREGEFHRMPDNLGVPRFMYPPMNLVMVCDFVVRHFYPEDAEVFDKEPSLKAALGAAQKEYLSCFLDRVGHYGRHDLFKQSFHKHMWGAR